MCAGGSCWIEGFSFIRDDSEHLHNYTDALLNLKFEVSLVELSFKLPFSSQLVALFIVSLFNFISVKEGGPWLLS